MHAVFTQHPRPVPILRIQTIKPEMAYDSVPDRRYDVRECKRRHSGLTCYIDTVLSWCNTKPMRISVLVTTRVGTCSKAYLRCAMVISNVLGQSSHAQVACCFRLIMGSIDKSTSTGLQRSADSSARHAHLTHITRISHASRM